MSFKRVKWKGILLKRSIHESLKKNKKNIPIQVYSRNSIITPNCIDKTFEIHNGIRYIKVSIIENMVGFKFGEFSATRAKNIYKKK